VEYRELSSLGLEPQLIGKDRGKEIYRVKIKDLAQTVEVIRRFILESSHNLRLRRLVARLIKKCKDKDFPCYIEKIVSFVKSKVHYVDDPQKLEILQSPEKTLEIGIGDCDDQAILTGALLRIAGFPVRIVLGDPNKDGRFEHVYLKVMLPNKTWLTVDPTASNPFAPKNYPEKEIKIAERSSQLSGETNLGRIRVVIKKLPLYRMPCSPIGIYQVTQEWTGQGWRTVKRKLLKTEKPECTFPRPFTVKKEKKEEKMGLFDSLFSKLKNIEIITPKKHYGIFQKDGSLQIVYTKRRKPIRVGQKAEPPQRAITSTSLPSIPSPPPAFLAGGALLLGLLLLGGKK